MEMTEEDQDQQFMCTSCGEPSELSAEIPGDVVTGNRYTIYKCPSCGRTDRVRRQPPQQMK